MLVEGADRIIRGEKVVRLAQAANTFKTDSTSLRRPDLTLLTALVIYPKVLSVRYLHKPNTVDISKMVSGAANRQRWFCG